MRRLRAWARRIAGVWLGSRHDQDLTDELASHVELHTDDNIRLGMPPEEARRVALVKLGGVQSVTQQYREQRGIPALEDLAQDVRYAARTLRRSPGFAAVALATIALGVAGPTLLFAMAKAWILDPLPFPRAGELVDIRNLDQTTGNVRSINAADFLDLQRDARSLMELAGYRLADVRLTGGERAERARGAQVTLNFFHLLGAQAAAGRVFEPTDAAADRSMVAVISHRLWHERFHGDPGIAGRAMRLDNQDHTIVGVLPETFQFTLLGAVDVWRPLVFTPQDTANRRPRSIVGIGRLQRTHTIDEARTELVSLADRLAEMYPETNTGRSLRAVGLADEVRLHHDAGFIVPVLFAMMCCVLLVACVNVANVMLARASARRQELAVRLALGASRARIIRQWLVEHVVLFVGASTMGILLAYYGAAWVTRSIPPENRQFLRNNAVLTIEPATMVFALVLGAICGALFGWLPAWTSVRADVHADLRDQSARTATSKGGTRLRGALAIGEVALALALLISAALLVATARNITAVDVGFDPRPLLAFELSLDQQQYREDADIRGFYERLTAGLARLPGVSAAAVGSLVPFGTEGNNAELFFDGQPDRAASETPLVALAEVSAGYARTLGLRLVAGRLLDESDGADAPRVAVINETLARRYFVDRDPLAERIRVRRGSKDVWQVVGVVADVKNFETIDRDEPQVYLPFAQSPRRAATVVVRSSGAPDLLAASVRAAVAQLDPAEPVSDVATMESRIGRVTAPFRTISLFVTFFGAVTLLLAGIGVYGVVSYSFAQRTREVGIRMALGARRTDVAALVLNQVRTFLLAGVVPGLALAWLLGQAMKAILFGVTPTDWRVYAAMSLLLTMVALLAALVPARRATAIDPTVALRYE